MRTSGDGSTRAFRRGGAERVRWLKFGPEAADNAWLHGDGWALTADAAE